MPNLEPKTPEWEQELHETIEDLIDNLGRRSTSIMFRDCTAIADRVLEQAQKIITQEREKQKAEDRSLVMGVIIENLCNDEDNYCECHHKLIKLPFQLLPDWKEPEAKV